MCNCGKKRAEFFNNNSSTYTPAVFQPSNTESNSKFQYTGNSSLTVTGNITGKKYHFSFPGDAQTVHYRDANFMMALPLLKKI